MPKKRVYYHCFMWKVETVCIFRCLEMGRGAQRPGRTARESIVAGYNNAFVEFEFHVLSSRSLRPQTGRSNMHQVYRCYNFEQSVKPVCDQRQKVGEWSEILM